MTVMIISGIAVDVQRKKIKNMHLRVTQECQVTLSVPLRTKDREIEEFVSSRKDWIEDALAKFKDASNDANQWYGQGGRICVLGKTYDVVEIVGPRLMCQISENAVYLTCPDDCAYGTKEKYMREWYRSILKDVLPDMFERWESVTDLHCSEWQTKYMKSRWGTCNPRTRKIWLNVRLAEKPMECIEYVVLHELAHIAVPDHGPRFKALLDEYMPDWQERKRILNYGIRSGSQ